MDKVPTFIEIIILTSVWQTLTCFGCDVGFWGVKCDKTCPVNCVTCTQESRCTACVPGKLSGRLMDFRFFPYYTDCRHDCRNGCVSCASYDNCTKCVDSRYGKECQYSCYSGCEGGQCDKIDGKCTCRIGYKSRYCKYQPSCTNTPCACCKNNKCETNNDNYCTDGCIHGVRGDTCDNDCPANCETCTQDSRDRLPCTACIPGKYSGRWRDYSYQPYHDDCRHDCRDKCVSCVSYDNCTECVDGRHGIECLQLCYSGCKGGVCDIDGKCTCKTGFTSRFCKDQPSCTNNPCACCKNNKCETNNGNYCVDGCIYGVWGDTCSNECPVNCVTCTQDSRDRGLPCTSCVPGKYIGRAYDVRDASYYDDCRLDCRYSCVSCASDDNCTECPDGRYGTECQYDCYSGCEGGLCDIDGKCTCKTGFTSRFCKDQPSCTNTPCACCKNNKCETNNGNYCTDGCIHGVRGDTCDNECPQYCETCTQDSRNRWSCTFCVSGKHSGRHWDLSTELYYDDCRYDCSASCVSCASHLNCTECGKGLYGTECQYDCYIGCEGGLCDIDGKCTCKDGYTSRWCYSCIDGYWGKTCDQECPANCVTCSQHSEDRGLPCTACVPGKYSGKYEAFYDHNDGYYVEDENVYYDDCRHRCYSNCESCTSWDNCTKCVDGQHGQACYSYCSFGCEDGKCNKTDGSCSCVNGRYGTRCDNDCGNGCQGGTCDKTNGSCSCKSGFTGVNCDRCASNTYGSYPNCTVCPDTCLTCISLSACSKCKPGYDINTNCSECLLNKYGQNCSSDCSSNCLNYGKHSKCNGQNGTCVVGCQDGFYGDKCELPCHQNCKQIACSRVNGTCSHGCQDGYIIFGSVCVPVVSNDDGDFPVSILGGAIGGGVAVVLIIVGIVVILIKRRNHRPQCCSTTTHDETPGPEDMQLVAVNAGDNETSEVCINGTISYHPGKVLGHGAHGIVYQGRYGRCEKRTVAVKIIKCSNNDDARDTHEELQNIYKEIKAMEILAEETHIIQFYDSYINNTTVYLVFKLAMGTLVDFIKNDPWRKSLTSDDVIRGLVNGLNHIHTMNIVHRDIKPGNIFIIDHGVSGLKAVIGDFGQAKPTTGNMFTFTGNFGSNAYTAPEIWTAMSATATTSVGTKFHKASDVFSLGLVAYYAISLGKHPFGNEMNAQVSISRGDLPTFNDIAHLINSFAYEDMLKGMLDNNPDDRPPIQVVSEHPALFTSDKVIKFFGLKSDEFESKIRAGTSNTNLLEDPNLIPNGNWMNWLPVNMRTYLRSYKLPNRASPLYKGHEKEVRFLLRAVRNTNGHFQAYPKNTQSEMGIFPEGHVDLWLTVCPGLLMHVYNKL